jgi:ABC-2 type transport system permease protein
MSHMPEAVRVIYGAGDVGLLRGWVQSYAFGGMIWIPVLIYTALFAAGMITREMDQRTMEFLLAMPVERWQVVLSRWLNLAAALLVLHLSQWGSLVAAVSAIGETPEAGAYLVAELNGALLHLALGSIMLVLTLLVDDYGRALALSLGSGLGIFLVYTSTADATGWLKEARAWLPYGFFDPVALIGRGEIPWGDLGVLAAMALAGLGLSLWLFQRKQIAV